jgi:hypothetical protein
MFHYRRKRPGPPSSVLGVCSLTSIFLPEPGQAMSVSVLVKAPAATYVIAPQLQAVQQAIAIYRRNSDEDGLHRPWKPPRSAHKGHVTLPERRFKTPWRSHQSPGLRMKSVIAFLLMAFPEAYLCPNPAENPLASKRRAARGGHLKYITTKRTEHFQRRN